MKRFDSIAIAFLFLMPALAGCLENNSTVEITVDDISVNPETMIAGEFQPIVITAKKDVAVFIPNLVIDPLSNYVQNGTVVDLRLGETKQLMTLAPPRIDSAFVFLSKYGNINWPIRNPNESWEQWVNRGGIRDDGLAVSRITAPEGS